MLPSAVSTSSLDEWATTLRDETKHVDDAGVGSAVITIRFTSTDDHERAIDVRRATSLLGRRLRHTDRIGGVTETELSVLSTPANEFVETHRYVRSIDAVLFDHCITALTSFAYRRPEEHLVDTWARSQAELDRAMYRELHADGICV